jgi:1,4-dihydroxy-2-naphthoate octaprenyltransferase
MPASSKVNFQRVFVGGILGGVVWSLWSMIINTALLAKKYAAAQAAGEFLSQPRYPLFLLWYILILIVLSMGLAWLYAVSRAALGPGPLSAMKVGLVVGLIGSVPTSFAQSAWAPFSRYFPLGWLLEGLVGCILATLFAGWYYRES